MSSFRVHQKILSELPKLDLNALDVFPIILCLYRYHNTYHSTLPILYQSGQYININLVTRLFKEDVPIGRLQSMGYT